MKKLLLTALILTSCIALLSGCGNDTGIDLGPGGCVTAPYDATITIQPGDTTFTFGGAVGPFTDSINVTIAVFDESGIPLNDVLVWIDFAWADPSPVNTVQFYDGDTAKGAAMNACTDVNGVYELRMDYDGGCGDSYFGDLIVHSGSVYATKVKFTVEGADCGS